MKRCAFTLVELLVVIAIIAVLAAVVLPIMSTSQEKARATAELNGLRQLGLGVQQCIQDNGETLFPMTAAPGATWPAVVQTKYVANWQSFKSPFDRRSDAAASPYPVSYGINAKTLADGTSVPASPTHYAGSVSEFISASELILMAPAPDSTPEVRFSGTSEMNVQIQPPATSPRLGTHGMRNWINVMYADIHVAQLSWTDYSDSKSKPAGVRRWFPLGF